MLSFKAMVKTSEPQLWVDKLGPEALPHILMVLSYEPLTRMFGFLGSKATQVTPSLLKHTKIVLKT